jgi:arylsulfatase A-like enzyme
VFPIRFLAGLSLCSFVLNSAERPNVLLIAIDDMNDWASCLGGHPDGNTPNIDRLAKRGTLFTNAHCQAPICNPSRASIMYGIRPSTSGVYMNAPRPWTVPSLKDKTTLPRWFALHGYHTMTTGKIYHGSGLPEGDFDEVGPRPGQRYKTDPRLVDIPDGGNLWDYGPLEYAEEKFQDHIDATWAMERLGERYEKPFMLAVGFYRPHVPFYAPARIFEDYPIKSVQLPRVKKGDRDDLPDTAKKVTEKKPPLDHDWFEESGEWKAAVQAYLACIQWTDEQVGRVLDALDASPHGDNTIIVLYSDHGFHLGEKHRWTKMSLWERSTRVPFVISAPEFPEDQVCEHPSELLSIYPTLTELCSLPENPDLEGESLVSLLENPESSWVHRAITTYGRNNHTVRSQDYRYIRYHDGSEEFYDMKKDPREWDNLATGKRKPKTQKLIDELAQYLPAINAVEAKASKK